MDVTKILEADHRTVAALFDQIEEAARSQLIA
jgi:hypothetical protein